MKHTKLYQTKVKKKTMISKERNKRIRANLKTIPTKMKKILTRTIKEVIKGNIQIVIKKDKQDKATTLIMDRVIMERISIIKIHSDMKIDRILMPGITETREKILFAECGNSNNNVTLSSPLGLADNNKNNMMRCWGHVHHPKIDTDHNKTLKALSGNMLNT